MNGFGKVAVFMGGVSSEREVSLRSGKAILNSLLRSGVNAFSIDLNSSSIFDLFDNDFDVAFLALHGKGGEDGCIQGVLEWMGKPYTGSGVMASAIAMDKYKTKQIWSMGGLYTPKAKLISCGDDIEEACESFNFPVMLKPIYEGSSIGVFKVDKKENIKKAFFEALKHDKSIMIEEYISGDEYTVSIVNDEVFPVIGMQSSNDFYDYDAKYFSSDTRYSLPSGLSDEMEDRLKSLSAKSYRMIGCEGWGRVDIIVDKSGLPWLIEVNSCPGMTETSLVPKAAEFSGINFDALVISILESARTKSLP